MARKELLLLRADNQDIKNKLIVALGERAIRSESPEYYGQAIRLVYGLEPALLVAGILGSRYLREDIAVIMNIQVSTLTQYRAEIIRHIRREVDTTIFQPHAAILPYFLGLIDVDTFTTVLEKI